MSHPDLVEPRQMLSRLGVEDGGEIGATGDAEPGVGAA
jgi:hypothetical protein